MKWLSDALLIFIVLTLMHCSDSRETRMQRHLVQGNEKIREQEYEQAERFFQEALRLDSCFKDALNNLGTVYHRRKNPAKAVSYYTKALACDSTYLPALLNRANVNYELKNYDAALSDLANAGALAPDTAVVQELSALVFWRKGEYRKARQYFRRTGIAAEDPELMINLGTLFAAEKSYDSGRYYLHSALEIDPRNHLAMNALAMLEVEAGNVVMARQLMDSVLAQEPRDAYYLNNRGYIHLVEGSDEKALPLIDESIALDPYNGWAYRNKGYYHLKKGNADEAIRLFHRALREDDRIDKLNLWLAEALFLKGDVSKACEHLAVAVELNEIPSEHWRKRCP